MGVLSIIGNGTIIGNNVVLGNNNTFAAQCQVNDSGKGMVLVVLLGCILNILKSYCNPCYNNNFVGFPPQ